MSSPDYEQLCFDLEGSDYLIGAAGGRWGRADPPHPEWPAMVFWVRAGRRPQGPEQFYLRLDCAGYPAQSPTGTFWDAESARPLDHSRWPKGGGQVTAVFRTDWEGGRALYHPYDRHGAATHPDWRTNHPHLIWTRNHGIAHYLSEVYRLLNSAEYTGV